MQLIDGDLEIVSIWDYDRAPLGGEAQLGEERLYYQVSAEVGRPGNDGEEIVRRYYAHRLSGDEWGLLLRHRELMAAVLNEGPDSPSFSKALALVDEVSALRKVIADREGLLGFTDHSMPFPHYESPVPQKELNFCRDFATLCKADMQGALEVLSVWESRIADPETEEVARSRVTMCHVILAQLGRQNEVPLSPEVQQIVEEFRDRQAHGIWMLSFGEDRRIGICAVDWPRLREGGCLPYFLPADEEHLRADVAHTWREAEGCTRVCVLDAKGNEEEMGRVLAMEGNLGDRFASMLGRLLN